MQTITLPAGSGSEIRLGGEVDSNASNRLRAVLSVKLRERHPLLIIECSELEFIDSCGLAALLEYERDAREFGGRLALVGLGESIEEVIRMVHLDRRVLVLRSMREANALAESLPAAGTNESATPKSL